MLKDCSGRRRAYSQRTSGASRISSASAGVGAPPAELLIFAWPWVPTNAYMKCSGIAPPKISRTSCSPTVKLEPGDEWSTPAGSKVTRSYAQRIGQSTFQTSLPATSAIGVGPCVVSHAQV
jgi:hypothetical protein